MLLSITFIYNFKGFSLYIELGIQQHLLIQMNAFTIHLHNPVSNLKTCRFCVTSLLYGRDRGKQDTGIGNQNHSQKIR